MSIFFFFFEDIKVHSGNRISFIPMPFQKSNKFFSKPIYDILTWFADFASDVEECRAFVIARS